MLCCVVLFWVGANEGVCEVIDIKDRKGRIERAKLNANNPQPSLLYPRMKLNAMVAFAVIQDIFRGMDVRSRLELSSFDLRHRNP